jgi:hypothetical protein
MINNKNFPYYQHRFFYHFLSSLILVCLLGACNNNPETIKTVSPIPTQQALQLPIATQQIPLTTSTENNSGPLPSDNNNGGGINIEQDSLIPPIPPAQLTVVSTQDCPELKWQGTGSDIIVSYKIYRRKTNTKTWNLIATVPMIGDNRGGYTFCDKTNDYQLSIYLYAISALDHYGNESALVEPKAIK